MAAWTDWSQVEIEEPSPGAGIACSGIVLPPGVTIEFTVMRTDASPVDAWRAELQRSSDPDSIGWPVNPSAETNRLAKNQTKCEITTSNCYACRVHIINDGGSTDKVKAIIGWRTDDG